MPKKCGDAYDFSPSHNLAVENKVSGPRLSPEASTTCHLIPALEPKTALPFRVNDRFSSPKNKVADENDSVPQCMV